MIITYPMHFRKSIFQCNYVLRIKNMMCQKLHQHCKGTITTTLYLYVWQIKLTTKHTVKSVLITLISRIIIHDHFTTSTISWVWL